MAVVQSLCNAGDQSSSDISPMKQVVNKNELMRLAAGHVALTAISNSQRRMAGDAAERVAAASTLC